MSKVAIVIPWFGKDLKGGAEQHAWQLATRLAARDHEIDVLTTCNSGHEQDWSHNHLPSGESLDDGVRVHRFAVLPRDTALFDQANKALLDQNQSPKLRGCAPVPLELADAFVRHNIHSPDLIQFLRDNSGTYRAIVFLPYLFGTTLDGLALGLPNTALLPCLHDESYAYLPAVEQAFHRASSLLFISEGEAALARRLYGPAVLSKGHVAGAGVEFERPQTTAPPPYRYLLSLGRRDATKNTPFLLDAFARFRAVRPNSGLRLVLAGPGDIATADAQIVDVGLVDEARKAELIAGCVALAQPSINESFSRVIMEAWRCAKPVLAHADCLATSWAVSKAGGGWLARGVDEWVAALEHIDDSSEDERAKLGACGEAYAARYAGWDSIIDQYERILHLRPARIRRQRRAHRAVHQLLPTVTTADAISEYALLLRCFFEESGYDSRIYAEWFDAKLRGTVEPLHRLSSNEACLIYHHSIGFEHLGLVREFRGPKALIYHNITPGKFFASWDKKKASLLEDGRSHLAELKHDFDLVYGVSAFNCEELGTLAFQNPQPLHIPVDPIRWDISADPLWMSRLQDGRPNLLFVGRVAPNKCQHDLVAFMATLLERIPDARLIIAGDARQDEAYPAHVRSEISRLGLCEQVILCGKVSTAALAAMYRTASLFLCMSEHEGFCVPLVEAMWADVPVVAYDIPAVRETLAGAGHLFSEKVWSPLAVRVQALLRPGPERDALLRAQRERRAFFSLTAAAPRLDKVLHDLDRIVHAKAAPRIAVRLT